MNNIGIATTVNKQNRKLPLLKNENKPMENENTPNAIKTQYLLNITAEGDRVLTKRIEEFVIPCMKRKL